VSIVLQHIDAAIQYGEDEDVAIPRDSDDHEQAGDAS
jgi:hypothetical protein